MNGPHDLGGQHGFGNVVPEPAEPAFHEAWERRAFALTLAMGATGAWNIDESRSARESIGHLRYLSSSYYQIWLAGLERLMLARGIVTEAELASGEVSSAPVALPRVLKADAVAQTLARGAPTLRPARRPARFTIGAPVCALNHHPIGHTRLPRYVRGRVGRIERIHGVHVFPDASVGGPGEPEQWLYSVAFEARALWGPDTTADSVCVDCWESMLVAVADR